MATPPLGELGEDWGAPKPQVEAVASKIASHPPATISEVPPPPAQGEEYAHRVTETYRAPWPAVPSYLVGERNASGARSTPRSRRPCSCSGSRTIVARRLGSQERSPSARSWTTGTGPSSRPVLRNPAGLRGPDPP